jgi:hypothetical protein
VAIGSNTASSIAPAVLGVTNWNYAIFNSFGGGVEVPDYSPGGAWVIAGSGGHGAPENTGAAVFDFYANAWQRLDCVNPNAPYKNTGANSYTVAETNGAPYYEILNSNQAPAPGHMYCTHAWLPAALGGGEKGSVLLITRAGVTLDSRTDARSVHRFDLATRTWTRYTNSTFSSNTFESDAIFDPVLRRYWHFQGELFNNRNSAQYMNVDGTIVSTPSYSYPSGNLYDGRHFRYRGYIFKLGRNNTLAVFDPQNPGLGWRTCNLNGTLLGSSSSQGVRNAYAQYADGKFYAITQSGGNTLSRLTPPNEDPVTGTWTVDSITVTGAGLAPRTNLGGQLSHYNSLFFVRKLGCMAWIAGGSAPVYLLRPTVS